MVRHVRPILLNCSGGDPEASPYPTAPASERANKRLADSATLKGTRLTAPEGNRSEKGALRPPRPERSSLDGQSISASSSSALTFAAFAAFSASRRAMILPVLGVGLRKLAYSSARVSASLPFVSAAFFDASDCDWRKALTSSADLPVASPIALMTMLEPAKES